MISRRSTKLLGDIYSKTFCHVVPQIEGRNVVYRYPARQDDIYDYLYEREHEPWVCNGLRHMGQASDVKAFVLRLHTTESISAPGLTHDAKVTLCQDVLRRLAESALADGLLRQAGAEDLRLLAGALELDGYVFRGNRLLRSEGETKDVEQERGELMALYVSLALPNQAIVQDCLDKSEQHYTSDPPSYRECIGTARHYFEQVVHDVALTWSNRTGQPPLVIGDNQPAAGPSRNYLRDQGVITADECTVFKDLHGLLSVAGGHPTISEREEARIFRRLALTMALFVLLRYQGKR